jgi:Ca2+-binding RTX toxin-like protein
MTDFVIIGRETTGQTLLTWEIGRVTYGSALDVVGRALTIADAASLLENRGSLSSQLGHAIVISGRSTTIHNLGGDVTSPLDVIYCTSASPGDIVIHSDGNMTATGLGASVVTAASGGVEIRNFATMQAQDAPVIVLLAGWRAENNVIYNTGTMTTTARLCLKTDRDDERVVNKGTMMGGIDLGDGTNTLRSFGTIIGDITCGSGEDTVDLRDTMYVGTVILGGRQDIFRGGSGNETVMAQAGHDKVYGFGGDDNLSGAFGRDTLVGGDGADTLDGGLNADRLAGGAGADVFVFNTLGTSTAFGRDHIADFQRGVDKIDLHAIIDRIAASPRGGPMEFIGKADFTGDRQIRIADYGQQILVEINNRGTTAPEFVVLVEYIATLTASDFIL